MSIYFPHSWQISAYPYSVLKLEPPQLCANTHESSSLLASSFNMGKSNDAMTSSKSGGSRRSGPSIKSQSGGKKKKQLTVRMESLALHTLEKTINLEDSPIAVRDYPDGCIPITENITNNTPHSRSVVPAKRRLQLHDESDEEDLQPHQHTQASSDRISAATYRSASVEFNHRNRKCRC